MVNPPILIVTKRHVASGMKSIKPTTWRQHHETRHVERETRRCFFPCLHKCLGYNRKKSQRGGSVKNRDRKRKKVPINLKAVGITSSVN